jgi:hypothetical protein
MTGQRDAVDFQTVGTVLRMSRLGSCTAQVSSGRRHGSTKQREGNRDECRESDDSRWSQLRSCRHRRAAVLARSSVHRRKKAAGDGGQAAPKAKAAPARATQTAAASKPKTEPRQAGGKPTAISDLLTGAAPTVPSGGFDSGFGVWR